MDDTGLYRRAWEGEPDPIRLPMAWLDVGQPGAPSVTREGARILVAGCGTGAEVAALSGPDLEVIGVDRSPAMLEAARERLGPTADLRQVDLTDRAALEALGPFDLVLCRAVADYVPDDAALLGALAGALAPHGRLLLTGNTPRHPWARVRAALAAVEETMAGGSGLDRLRWGLRATAACDPRVGRLVGRGDGYVAMDLGPDHVHHRPLKIWADRARRQGLHLVGSVGAPASLDALADEDVAPLLPLARAGWARLEARLGERGAFTGLFGRRPPIEPPLDDPGSLAGWTPVPGPALRDLQLPPPDPVRLTVPMEGHRPWSVRVPRAILAAVLEGEGPVGRRLAVAPWRTRVALFRLTQADLTRWRPPGT